MDTRTDKGPITEVRNIAAYPQPIQASYRGRLVNLIATGDSPGHSPVCQFVDGAGQLGWGELSDFLVGDTRVLPNEEAFRQVAGTLTADKTTRPTTR